MSILTLVTFGMLGEGRVAGRNGPLSAFPRGTRFGLRLQATPQEVTKLPVGRAEGDWVRGRHGRRGDVLSRSCRSSRAWVHPCPLRSC